MLSLIIANVAIGQDMTKKADEKKEELSKVTIIVALVEELAERYSKTVLLDNWRLYNKWVNRWVFK